MAQNDLVLRVGNQAFACSITWTLPNVVEQKPSKSVLKQEARRNGKTFQDDLAAYRLSAGQVGTTNRKHGHQRGMPVAADCAASWLRAQSADRVKTLFVMPVDPDEKRYWILGITETGLILPATDKIVDQEELPRKMKEIADNYTVIYLPTNLQFPTIGIHDPRRRPPLVSRHRSPPRSARRIRPPDCAVASPGQLRGRRRARAAR